MRIVLTGVSGQVGSALLSRLQVRGTIVPLDKDALDLARLETISATLDVHAPDLIINPAAFTAVERAEEEPELAMRINGEAAAIIAGWASDRGVPLIHFSTDYVYDGRGERPWREDDDPRPLSVYARTKLAGDQAIRGAGGSHLILRTSWVYAAHGKNFLRTISRLALEQKELRVIDDQIGAPTSAAIIADVAAKILAGGIEHLRERGAVAEGLVNVCSSGKTSWHGFALAIIDGLRRRGVPVAVERVIPVRSADYPTRATRPLNSQLDLTRLKEVFGITPPHWRAALEPELDKLALELTAAGSTGSLASA